MTPIDQADMMNMVITTALPARPSGPTSTSGRKLIAAAFLKEHEGPYLQM